MLCVDYFGVAINWIANCFVFWKYWLQISDGNWLRWQEYSGFTQSLPLKPRIYALPCPVQFIYIWVEIWSMALYGAETWTLRAADQKYLESFEMWCWRRMEKISWTDHVKNKEVLLRVNERRNILHEIRKRNANCICHILHRNCLLKQFIEGKLKG